MNDPELIQLYQDLTGSGEVLARSVAMFVQFLPLNGSGESPPPPSRHPRACRRRWKDPNLRRARKTERAA